MKNQMSKSCVKIISLFCFVFCIQILSFSQTNGSIISSNSKPAMGGANVFYYTPPGHLPLPEKIFAAVVYKQGEKNFTQTFSIKKTNGRYQFSTSDLDSSRALIIGITDENRNVLDNNNGSGYIMFLYDKKETLAPSAYLEAADLLDYYARISLSLDNSKSQGLLLNYCETSFRLSPELKNENDMYRYYLSLLYEEKKGVVKPTLLDYAKRMSEARRDEDRWLNAISIYKTLSMPREADEIEKKAISIFPDGKIAREKYLRDLNSDSFHTEQFVLDKMTYYTKRFGDTSDRAKNTFGYLMIGMLLEKKEYEKLVKYEDLANNKLGITYMYNSVARNLLNESIRDTDDRLKIARMVSSKAINLTAIQIDNRPRNLNDGLFENAYKKYAGTYARILYRLKEYDSAFYYQGIICNKTIAPDLETLELYALYAEKARGDEFAYRFIIDQLSRRMITLPMLNQLKMMHERSVIPDKVYDSLRNVGMAIIREKRAEEIEKRFGTTRAETFTLKNIDGQTVSLSQFKNKIIVLDFWATWCVPCKASFPALQETVNKYKNDPEVVFLLVNTWEDKRPQEVHESAAQFIRKNNYSFNVLLDENDNVVSKYKIKGIPTKVVIDKNGDVVYFGDLLDISSEIENARN